jgi:hypothetical protein
MSEDINADTLSDEDFMNEFGSDLETALDSEVEELLDEEPSSTTDEEAEPAKEEVTVDEEPSTEGEEESEVEETDANPEVSREDQLTAIYAPFKANGVDISVTSPQEAIRLMQQGAGASKRMQDLAPKLKILQMLENNDLLSEDKINQLIAVGTKDPKAIAAYLKDAEIDPFTLDLDQEDYTQQDHTVSDTEFELKQTINDLADQPKFQETLDTADSWDESSKQIAMNEPAILTTINSHLQSGVYEQVAGIVEQEMVKGNIARTTPFLEAYNKVGNQLREMGAFDQSTQAPEGEQNTDLEGNATTSNKGNNEQLNSRRKAASSTKTTGSTPNSKPNKEDKDLYKMSDEDFMKEYANEEWMSPI